jgi:hypothetical protein
MPRTISECESGKERKVVDFKAVRKHIHNSFLSRGLAVINSSLQVQTLFFPRSPTTNLRIDKTLSFWASLIGSGQRT